MSVDLLETKSKVHITAVSWILCLLAMMFMPGTMAQEAKSVAESGRLTLHLKPTSDVATNLVRLSDLIDPRQSAGITQSHLDLALAPSPTQRADQVWERVTIEDILALKGISARAITWQGSQQCHVRRVNRIVAAPTETTSNGVHLISDSQVVQASDVQPIASAQFQATGNLSKVASTSERNAIAVLQEYLRTKSDSDFDYDITVDIPPEGVPLLRNKNDIKGITGGNSPWIGNQKFALQVKMKNEFSVVEIGANVAMPLRVFATMRNLGKDHILSESDLKLIVLPKSSRVELGMCFTSLGDLVGKQLTRTLATGQAIERAHVGNPRLVSQNDEVEIQVLIGGLSVSTKARALQGGGLNELIVVEVPPKRTKVTARVVSAGMVSVIAN